MPERHFCLHMVTWHSWEKTIDELNRMKLTDKKVLEYMQEFFPITPDMSDKQQKNNLRLITDLKRRYFDAPDLQHIGKNGYRFINAVSDFATHADPIRKTKTQMYGSQYSCSSKHVGTYCSG